MKRIERLAKYTGGIQDYILRRKSLPCKVLTMANASGTGSAAGTAAAKVIKRAVKVVVENFILSMVSIFESM